MVRRPVGDEYACLAVMAALGFEVFDKRLEHQRGCLRQCHRVDHLRLVDRHGVDRAAER